MPIAIKPQDKTPEETLQVQLHPALILRLKNYAKALNDSDVSYVVSQIMDQALPSEKPAKARPLTATKKSGKGTS